MEHPSIIDPQIKNNISFSLVPASWKICGDVGHFCAADRVHTALFREPTGVMKTTQ